MKELQAKAKVTQTMTRDGLVVENQAKESRWQIRVTIRRRDAYRTKVGKCVSQLPRKAAIVCTVPVP